MSTNYRGEEPTHTVVDPEAPGPPPPPAVWRAAALFHAAGRRRLEQADAERE